MRETSFFHRICIQLFLFSLYSYKVSSLLFLMGMYRFLLLLFLFLSMPLPLVQAAYFPDVPENAPSQGAIEFLYKLSVVDGNADGTFAPERVLNRAEFAKMVVMAEQVDTLEYPTTPCFEDVPVNTWYAPYVCTAKKLGYMKGDGNEGKIFRPSDTLLGVETLAVMDRQFQWNSLPNETDRYWYEMYQRSGEKLGVLPPEVVTEGPMIRRHFAEVMARSIVIYDYNLPSFTKESLFLEYFGDAPLPEKNCQNSSCVEDPSSIEELSTQIQENDTKVEGNAEGIIARYLVTNEAFTLDKKYPLQDSSLSEMNTLEKHEEIWGLFTKLIPSSQRMDVQSFQVFSDGVDNVLAAVELDENNFGKWIVSVDLADSFDENGTLRTRELTETLIHEYAHILTLRAGQLRLYADAEENDEARKMACKTYYLPEGCALLDSYVYLYHKEFWSELIKDHPLTLDSASQEYEAELDAFYERHKEEFVTSYAATNPEEDMAETFIFFVVEEKPTGTSMRDRKILFFWNFPVLRSLRTYIRGQIG